MKRTVGRRLKLAFNVDDILAAMTRIYGDPKEPWRAVNGFWGKLAMELGLKNKILVRKNFLSSPCCKIYGRICSSLNIA